MARNAGGEPQRAGRNWTEFGRDFDLRGLLRLTGWAAAAVTALFIALATAMSDNGAQRLIGTSAAGQGAEAASFTPSALAVRAAAAESAIRQLTDAVHRLTAEREDTAARLTALERSLDDVTGSIKATAVPSPSAPAASPASMPAAAAPQTIPPQVIASAATVPQASSQPDVPSPAPQETAAATPSPEPTPIAQADFGVDVGGAVNFDGLRVLWSSTRDHNPALFEGLIPIVAVRESSKTHAAELRLVVGPLASTDAAGRICAALSATRRYCQPVAFEGQRLLLADAVPEHKPAAPRERRRAAAAERKPAASP